MQAGIHRRRTARNLHVQNIFFGGSLILACIFILITIFFSIPTIYAYVVKKGYISPLASKFSTHEALGNTVSKDTVKKSFAAANIETSSIDEFDDGYIVQLKGKEKVILTKQKPLSEQISSLQLISSRLTIEGKHFSQLDLRFDRPVLSPK